MANTINLTAETGANYIGDDSSPALTLENSSTGSALLVETTNSTNPGVEIRAGRGTTIGAVTVAPLRLLASGPSAAVLELKGTAFTSAVTSGSVIGAIRVKYGDSYYWVPVTENIATS